MAFLAGCICSPGDGISGYSTAASVQQEGEADEAGTTSTTAVESTDVSQPAPDTTHTTATLEPQPTTTTVKFDLKQVKAVVAACAEDDYGNAMVAGYVTNPTGRASNAFTIVTYLMTDDKKVVEGGEKTLKVSNLGPGVTREFKAVYEKPPRWDRCSAEIKPAS
ncbi:MAG: hypothetical protein GF416_02210 [Candidatus Altiarchaeales archaeon]|nr:hypothetical protein [Candidatus Altiarchaeales archaeon]